MAAQQCRFEFYNYELSTFNIRSLEGLFSPGTLALLCPPPPINADGLTHLCEILAERAGGLALDGMVVHVVVVERGVVDPSCCGDYVVVGHAGLL